MSFLEGRRNGNGNGSNKAKDLDAIPAVARPRPDVAQQMDRHEKDRLKQLADAIDDARPAEDQRPAADYQPQDYAGRRYQDLDPKEIVRSLRACSDVPAVIGELFSQALDLDQWLEAAKKMMPFLQDERCKTPEGLVFVLRAWTKTLGQPVAAEKEGRSDAS